MSDPKPSLLCRIIGHNWTKENKEDKEINGDMYRITDRSWIKFCRRCGAPNPNYEENEQA